jgi:hypothetical protein
MSGLQKLGVEVYGIQVVSIDAPSLENFCYCPDDSNMEFKIYFDTCRNLKQSIRNTFFTYKWFLELFSKFPFLESLKLNYCEMPERIYNLREFLQNIKPPK